MSDSTHQGGIPSLFQVMQQLARDWRTHVQNEKNPATVDGVKEYLALPIRTLTSLIAKTLGYAQAEMEWVAWYSDRAPDRTPRKRVGHFNTPDSDPELDGIPEDLAAGRELEHLRLIHAELTKCDKDGRTAIFAEALQLAREGIKTARALVLRLAKDAPAPARHHER